MLCRVINCWNTSSGQPAPGFYPSSLFARSCQFSTQMMAVQSFFCVYMPWMQFRVTGKWSCSTLLYPDYKNVCSSAFSFHLCEFIQNKEKTKFETGMAFTCNYSELPTSAIGHFTLRILSIFIFKHHKVNKPALQVCAGHPWLLNPQLFKTMF